MKAFRETVALVTDQPSVEMATALRGVLDLLRVRTDYYRIVQKPHLLKWLAGDHPPYDYTVLCAFGSSGAEPGVVFEVVDQVDGDYEAETGWDAAWVELTAQTVPELVRGSGGTLIAPSGGTGSLAHAFLDAGYDAYVGMDEAAGAADATLMFTLAFFYFALGEDRPMPVQITDAQAVARAAAMDGHTRGYRYYAA